MPSCHLTTAHGPHLNTGVAASGKTYALKLSCNRFVHKDFPTQLANRNAQTVLGASRCAIYITFNGNMSGQDVDEHATPRIRVYNRILFALRDDRNEKFDTFLHKLAQNLRDASEEVVTSDFVLERIREDKTHVLIAADELLGRADEAHIPVPECTKRVECIELPRARVPSNSREGP